MRPDSNLTLEEIDQRIAKTTVEAAIEIGYYLKQIRDRKLYEQAGCRDVFEYAQKQYGYEKSVASRHMSRNDRFSIGGNSPQLAPEYLSYGKSQLQEMISMTEEQLEQVKPDMTVRKIKELKKKTEKKQKLEPVATSQQSQKDLEMVFKEEQPLLSAYGLPGLEYPPDSLLSEAGCGEFGGILHHCFSCCMNGCQIRGVDNYCVEAPFGNPFSCKTWLLMEQESVRCAAGEQCLFVEHDLSYHTAGSSEAVPCCKDCEKPCKYRCECAAGKQQEEKIVDGDFREVEEQSEDDQYEDASEKTDRELAQSMLDKEKRTLKLVLGAFTDNDEYARKQKILVAALAGYVCDLDIQQDQKDQDQPELPILRNNEQRKAWLRAYKDWGLWYRDEYIGVEYYKFDFDNGARLIAEVYQNPGTEYRDAYESCYLHLVGGPALPKGNVYGKWTRHKRYSKFPNSESEVIEFLKETQRVRKESGKGMSGRKEKRADG